MQGAQRAIRSVPLGELLIRLRKRTAPPHNFLLIQRAGASRIWRT
jgi:hypothetical protein